MRSNYLCCRLSIPTIVSIFLLCWPSLCRGNSNNGQSWPLRFHQSPWLERSYLIRDDDSSHYNDMEQSRQKCDENAQQDYGRSSSGTCQSEKECSFIQSSFCEREIARRQEERDEESLSINEVLSHNYINPSTRIMPNKDGRKRELPSEFEQCHYLTDALITDMCSSDRQHIRRDLVERFRLRNCRRFSLEKALTSDLYQQVINSKNCTNILRELLTLDNLVEELACEYESILQRYDCDAKWSVKWTCKDCRLAYREWLCSTYIPYHVNGLLIKPCQSICEQVEQRCPHLHPYGKSQYAGEPVFLCIDPDIPFNQELTPNIPFGPSEWCYDSCDLEPCLNERGEAPVVDCKYNLPITTTTAAPVETVSGSEIVPEPEDESVQLFEEEFESKANQSGQFNASDAEQGTIVDTSSDSAVQAASSMDSGEMPMSQETTTEFEWTKDALIGVDSSDAEFERESQTFRNSNGNNLNDVDTPDASQLDYSTLPAQNEMTTSRPPPWTQDEDYSYIIEAGPIESSKQSQSIQYLELEPLYNKAADNGADNAQLKGQNAADRVVNGDNTKTQSQQQQQQQAKKSEETTTTTEAFQEIFERALLPTVATSAEGTLLKELTLSDDDIQPAAVQSTVVKADNWRNQANQQIIYSPSTSGRSVGQPSTPVTVQPTVTAEPVGSTHYRHSRSHRASNKNSAVNKQQQEQYPRQQQQQPNRFRNILQTEHATNSFAIAVDRVQLAISVLCSILAAIITHRNLYQ